MMTTLPLLLLVLCTNTAATQPATRPATTQSTAITLRFKVVSAEQIDLTWTALPGAATYLVQLSEDGVDYHESIDVEGTDTTASLVGMDEGQAGQKHHIRVKAIGASGRSIGESNVCVVTSPP